MGLFALLGLLASLNFPRLTMEKNMTPTEYNGQSVTLPTWEDDGKGNPYHIDAAFRSYGSVENSLQDYVDFLEGSYYVGVHRSKTKSYKDATAALTGVYATDITYGDKLNSIIEQYQLTIYDTY